MTGPHPCAATDATDGEASGGSRPSLAVNVGGLALTGPVLTASGTYGLGYEFARIADLSRIGGVVGKTVTRKERLGNPPPRTFETAGGMLNSIGLMNPGWDGFVSDVLPRVRDLPCPFVLNVAGESLEDFVALSRQASELSGIAALELNLSCPNVAGGMDFSTDPERAEEVVSLCREVIDLPLFAKLSPNVGDVVPIARACERGGADGLSLVNTYVGTAIDWRGRRTVLPRGVGGLSGPAIKPMVLRLVMAVAREVTVPIIGIGGICDADDVLEYLVAGASAVQVGTICFLDPEAPVKIADGLVERLRSEGIDDVRDLVGAALGDDFALRVREKERPGPR